MLPLIEPSFVSRLSPFVHIQKGMEGESRESLGGFDPRPSMHEYEWTLNMSSVSTHDQSLPDTLKQSRGGEPGDEAIVNLYLENLHLV